MRFQALRSSLRVLSCAALIPLSTLAYAQQDNVPTDVSSQKQEALKTFRSLNRPLTFEANQGQFEGKARFLAHGSGYKLFLRPDEAVVSLSPAKFGAVTLKLMGANPRATLVGENELTGKTNYYIGNDPKQWHIGVPNFLRVRYRAIYPGIDLVYYGNQRTLEHDFVVAPGADPGNIHLSLAGATSAHVDSNGDLILELAGGNVRLLKPQVYQKRNGAHHRIVGRYVLRANNITFALGKYDRRRELVIDPKLSYSSYLGGSNTDVASGLAVSGNVVYLAGTTNSNDFPGAGTNPACPTGCAAAFVSAVSPISGLVFSTYLSASIEKFHQGSPLALDGSGNVYVTGTATASLPIVSSGLSGSFGGGQADAFVAKLSPTGTLLASGFLGGLGNDYANGITFDPATSHILITGGTSSTDFPVLNPLVALETKGQLRVSPDAGTTWSLTSGSGSSALGGMDVQAVLIVPGVPGVSPNTYYVGGSAGVYESTDGATWSAFNTGLTTGPVLSLAYDPSSHSLYAGTGSSLYKSSGGGSWSQLPTYTAGGYTDFVSVIVNPASLNQVFAMDAFDGVVVSNDSGATWTHANSSLPTCCFNSLAMGPSGTLYAFFASSLTASASFYTSTDGINWTAMSGTGLPSGPYDYRFGPNALWVDNNTGNIYLNIASPDATTQLGVVQNYVSSDGGNTWTALGSLGKYGNGINVIIGGLSGSNLIYAGTDDGIYQSNDSGQTWARLDNSFTERSVQALAIDSNASAKAGNAVLYAGSKAGQGFIAALTTSLSPVFSTPLGGTGLAPCWEGCYPTDTQGSSIIADGKGNSYTAISTFSDASHLPGSQSGSAKTPFGDRDGFVLKLNSGGSAVWGSFIGGSGWDDASGVAITPDNGVVVSGSTISSDFATTAGAYSSSCSTPCFSIFYATKFNSGGALQFATYVPGVGGQPFMALDNVGDIYVAGSYSNTSSSFPTANPLVPIVSGLPSGSQAAITELDPAGSKLLFSTLLGSSTAGSSFSTQLWGIATDASGNVYATGSTDAPDFPIAGSAVQTLLNNKSNNGANPPSDAFLIQITRTGASNDVALQVNPTSVSGTPGQVFTFNITASNLTTIGNGASNVVLASDLALSSLTSPNGTCTLFPARCSFGTLPPHGSVTATATMAYPSAGTFNNVFTIHTDDDDPNPGNNSVPVAATIVSGTGSDLSVVLSGPSRAAHDSQFNYTLTITNNGPAASTSFYAQATLDPSLIFITSDINCFDDGGVFCQVGNLNPGASQSFLITVQAPSTTGTVTSTASISYSGDPNSSNDSFTANTSIAPSADLGGYFNEIGTAIVGAPIPLAITAENFGPDAASNVSVTLQMPSQLTLSPMPSNCTGNGTVTCVIGAMSSGSSPTLQIPVVANYSGVYTILASIQDIDQNGSVDPNPGNNQINFAVFASTNNSANESFVVSFVDSGRVGIYSVGSFGGSYVAPFKASSAAAISAIDQSGRYMYVGSSGFSEYTSVVDFTVQHEVARIHGAAGRPMVLTPDGSRLIAKSVSTTTDALAVIDTNTFQIVKTISLDGLFGDQVGVADLTISSGVVANNKLYLQLSYVPNTGTPLYTTAVINLGTFTVSQVEGASSSTTIIPGQQRIIAASADGTRVYALRTQPGEVLVINTSSDSVISTISLPLTVAASIATTRDPHDPNGQFAYVGGRDSSTGPTILTVDLSTGSLGASATLSFVPTNLLLSADGSILYAFHNGLVVGQSNGAMFYTNPLTPAAPSGGNEFSLPGLIGGVAIGFVNTVSNFSPTITSTLPSTVDATVPTKLSILGSNFTSDTRVKVGHLDSVPGTFVSTGRLDVNLPALVPEQDATLIVTVPNTQEIPTGRNVSAASNFKLGITNPTFTLPNSLLLMRYGDSVINLVSPSKVSVNIGTIPNPTSAVIAPDNQTVYVSSGLYQTGVQAISLSTGQTDTNIPVPNDYVGYQDGLATGVDPVDGKAVLYFASGDSNKTNDQLTVVDADSTSPTFNQVKRVIATNDGTYGFAPGALAASPSGRYVYSFSDAYSPVTGAFLGTTLIAYDVKTGAFNRIQNVLTAFNGDQNVPNHMRVSPDGNWIIIPGADGSVKALNISADPMLSTYTVVTLSDPGKSYKTFQVVGNRLFAFDANNNTVTAFNFLPANSNFSKLGSVTIPGPGSYYEGPLTVDPTGSYVYIAMKDQDAIAALDANKVAASDPTALLDEGADNFGIEAILITNPINSQVSLVAAYPSQPSFPETGSAYATGTVTNSSINDAHNVVVTVTPQAGITPTSSSWYTSGNNYTAGTCTIGSTAVTCNIPVLTGGSPAGDTVNIIVGFTAPSASQSPVTFTMSATSTESPSPSNTATASITIVPAADLSVSAQFPTGPLQAGQNISYPVTVTNLGPSVSPTAFVSIFGALNNLSVTPPQGVTCSSGFCSISNLAPNAPLIFTVSGTVPGTSSSISLNAGVSSSGSDPNFANNNASVNIPVVSSGVLTDQFLFADMARGELDALNPSNLAPTTSGSVGVVPQAIVPMPNGRTVFVVNFDANYISVFDLTIQAEIYRIQGEPGRAAVLSSDASQLFVANRFDTTKIDVYDTSTFALVKHISIASISGNPPISNMFVAGNNLYLMARVPTPIFVVNLTTNAVTQVTSTQTYGTDLSHRFAITPDGNTLVAIGGGDPNTPARLYLVNAANATLAQTIVLPTNTTNLSLAVTPKSGGNVYAYVTMDASLQMLDLTTGSPTYAQFLPSVNVGLPLAPASSAITSDGVTLAFMQTGENVAGNNVSEVAASSLLSQPSFISSSQGTNFGAIVDVQTDFLPPANAPQISSVTPSGMLNNVPNIVQINGSNFSSDAVVKIGTANPIVPSNISATQLTITVPVFTPSGSINIVVVDQNLSGPLAGRNVASQPFQIEVVDSPSFNPQFDSFTSNYGNGVILKNGTQGTSTNTTQIANPWGITVSSADVWYVTSFVDSAVETSLAGEGSTRIPLTGGVAYGDSIYLAPDPTTGRQVALVPSLYTINQGISYDWQLNVIDADPYSPTASTILRTIAANETNVSQITAGFAVAPNGKFAYQQVYKNDGTSDFLIYDLTVGSVTSTSSSSVGIDPFVQGLQISPDSNYLAVADFESNNIKIFSLAVPASPVAIATIPIANPNKVVFTDCCNLRIVNNKLYAFDPGTMTLQAFNFLPATPDFSAQGLLQLPGHLDPTYQGGFAVTSDGAYAYVAEMDDDAVEVIDTSRIATGNVTQALVTRFSSQGQGPVSIGLDPLPTFTNTVDLSVSVSHTPDPVPLGSNITYQITATSLGPSTSAPVVVSDVLPAGTSFVSATFSGSNTGSCTGTTVVTCLFGTMAPNDTTVINLIASTTGVAPGQIVDTVQIGQTSQTVPDPNAANNIATDTANLAGPDLKVTVAADNSSPSANGTVNFTISVVNNGGGPATNVSVSSTLDAGSLALPNQPNCSLNGSTYTCTFSSVAPRATVSYVEAAQMPPTAGAVHLTTVATETESDANPSDNTAVTTIAVGGGADLSIAAGGAPVIVGGATTYTVVVTNNGPNSAANVVLTDSLTRFQYLSATSTVGSCSYDGVNVTCALGTMTNNASVTVNVSVVAPDSGWASNEFHATSTTFDPLPTNNIVNMGPFGGIVGNTAAGANVSVDALDASTGEAVNFLFASVTKPGSTTVTSAAGTQPPTGYRFGTPAWIYNLSTTALHAGNIRVVMQLAGTAFHHPSRVRLFHMENGSWIDRTVSIDASHGLITAVTSSLSPFAITEPDNATPVANPGTNQTIPAANSTGAPVTLDGSASTDADSDPLTYTWTGPFPEGNGTVTGVSPKVTLPLGTSSITLIVNDGEVNSTPVATNITVSDFLIAAPTTPIVVARGQSTSFNVVLSPKYGAFDEAVTVACGALPAGLSCALTTSTATPGTQGTTATVTLTAAPSASLRPSTHVFAFWLGGFPLFGVLFAGKLKRKKLWLTLLFFGAILLLAGMAACGGGGSASLNSPAPTGSTATITLTGTAGSLQHSANATVVIQ